MITGLHQIKRIATFIKQLCNGARYVMRGDFDGLLRRIKARQNHAVIETITFSANTSNDQLCWGVMTTLHTLFIAHLVARQLTKHGYNVTVLLNEPSDFSLDWYLVICPQAFNKLPPKSKRIVFQMEQSTSSRWFTPRYLEILKSSLAVIDYSLVNLEFLSKKGIVYPQVHYLPIGAFFDVAHSQQKADYDILFYGDSKSSARRRLLLAALKKQFNVYVVNEVFGQDMQRIIQRARVVINLHYYDDALLEIPRIQECLSLGVAVVSESAKDQDDYAELTGAVRFFEQGSIESMYKAVQLALDEPVRAIDIEQSVNLSEQRFAFMFDRFMVAMGFLSASYGAAMPLPIQNAPKLIALSLPETIERRRLFELSGPKDCAVFAGIRRRPGWIGCALSYAALAHYALKNGISYLGIMEDDVLLPPDFESKMRLIDRYLEKHSGKWDVFSGVMATLHDNTTITSVEEFEGITFVTINKMISTVFNIYSEKALTLLASWNSDNLDAGANTIDRYLERQSDLRVVVTLPFFVGHREELHSTIWGVRNDHYSELIAESEQALQRMVFAYQSRVTCDCIPVVP